MYSVSARLNSIFFFTIFTLAALCALNILTGKIRQVRNANIDFDVIKINRFNVNPRYGWEEISLDFNLKANLTEMYNWNVKQLFLYVTVTFNNPVDNKTSEVTIFDQIIQRSFINTKFHSIEKKNIAVEYLLRDVYRKLKNQKVNFHVWVEIMPIVGPIERVKLHTIEYTLPISYT